MSTPSIRGVLPAAITPRHADTVSIDVAAALELIEFLESHGVDGITLLGSTGEFPHFTPEDRIRFVDLAIKRGRVPMLVNVSHSTLDGAVEMGRAAMESGAAGVLIMPPYYYRYSQDAIRAYCLDFAAQVKAPVYLYNIPIFTNGLNVETSLDLLATGAFAGIKDSGGGWEDFVALERSGLAVFVGADTMYARAARAGAAGSISGTASVLPELMVALDRRARAGEDTVNLEALVAQFVERAMSIPFPIGYREAASMRGLKVGPNPSPLGPRECVKLEEFRGWFREWLKQVAK